MHALQMLCYATTYAAACCASQLQLWCVVWKLNLRKTYEGCVCKHFHVNCGYAVLEFSCVVGTDLFTAMTGYTALSKRPLKVTWQFSTDMSKVCARITTYKRCNLKTRRTCTSSCPKKHLLLRLSRWCRDALRLSRSKCGRVVFWNDVCGSGMSSERWPFCPFFFFILKTINRFLKASALKVRSPYMSCPYSAQIPRLFAHFRTQLPLKAFDVYCLRKVDLSNL